jgi:hypothetical protein
VVGGMRILFMILMLFILKSCYTQFADVFDNSNKYLPISDSTVFLPNQNFMTAQYEIKDLYGEWINSIEEGDTVIKIYRKKDPKEFPPARFRSKIKFYENGDYYYLVVTQDDRQKFIKNRWRISKENSNVIHIFDAKGRKYKSFLIKELQNKLLKLVWTPGP